MNISIEEIQNIIDHFKSLRQKAEKSNLLLALENIHQAVFQDNEEGSKVIDRKEFEKLIQPLSIEEFFNIYTQVRGFSIVKLNSGEKYGLQRELLESDIEAIKSLLNCKELDNPELAGILRYEMERRYDEAIYIIEDFYMANKELNKFGLISKLGEILENEVSDYFA